ncbi:hypothetical protein ABPG75_003368 [Micractinium tetrahymenae]
MAAVFRIPQPDGLELARQLVVGARVARFWRAPFNEWYEAEVFSVDDDLEADPANPEDVPQQGVFYVLLRYPEQEGLAEEHEDVKWDLLFNSEDGGK